MPKLLRKNLRTVVATVVVLDVLMLVAWSIVGYQLGLYLVQEGTSGRSAGTVHARIVTESPTQTDKRLQLQSQLLEVQDSMLRTLFQLGLLTLLIVAGNAVALIHCFRRIPLDPPGGIGAVTPNPATGGGD